MTAGDYTVFNVESGKIYEWSLITADGGITGYDSQLTLHTIDGADTTVYCYSDDYSDLDAKIRWEATFTGAIRVLITEYDGLINTTSTTLCYRNASVANDECSNAELLNFDTPANGDIFDATNSGIETCYGTANNDVWYKFVAGSHPHCLITVTPSDSLDAVIQLLSGVCNGDSIECMDMYLEGEDETISRADLIEGNTYYIRVYDYWEERPYTTDFTINITTPDYCIPNYTVGTNDGDFIDGVVLESISNTSSGTTGASYVDYTNLSTNLRAGEQYSITLTNGDYDNETIAVWIDYDNDSIFNASENEKILEITSLDVASTSTLTFTVPTNAIVGNTRMRVRSVWGGIDVEPCTTYGYGEAEDYTINILAPCETPGIPASLSTSSITLTSADFDWNTGSPSGSATVTYYWAVGTASDVTYDSGYTERGTTTSTSASTSALSQGNTYYWTVKAKTDCGQDYESAYAIAEEFDATCTTPGTPQSLTTTGETNNGASFSWTANATAGSANVSYRWVVSTSSGATYGGGGNADEGITTDLSAETYILSSNTTYYWRVQAVTDCDNSFSSYGAEQNFTTTSIPTPLITWTGGTSSEWNNADNWDADHYPTADENALIPSGCSNYPITQYDLGINNSSGNASRVCKSLTIRNGASVTQTGGASHVFAEGNIDIEGQFNHESTDATNSFIIYSGGVVSVKNGGVINVGSSSFSGTPGGIIKSENDIHLDGGELNIEPGGEVFVMDNLIHASGNINMEGGELWIRYYGNGTASGLGFDLYGAANLKITGGDIYICGQESGGMMLDWNSSATVSITGGTFHFRNEQSSGSTDNAGTFDFGGHDLYNLVVNRTGASSTIKTSALKINGDLTITAGTLANGNNLNIELAGNWSNSGTYTKGTETVTLTGNGKSFLGSSQTSFNSLTFNANSSYTIEPSADRIKVYGTFTQNANSTLTIADNKILDLYGNTIVFNGATTSHSSDVYDETREIDINNTATLSGNGTINSDLRIYDGTTTLGSDINLNGNFIINNATTEFDMSSYTLTLAGDFINNDAFTRGTGTVVFTGSSKVIKGGSIINFNNLIVNSGASITVNPSLDDINIYGNLTTNGTLTIASSKWIDIYSPNLVVNGKITAVDKYDGAGDIVMKSNTNLSGTNTLNVDLYIYDNTTTLTSDFDLDGDFIIRDNSSCKFSMESNTLNIAGNWTNSGDGVLDTLDAGTIIFDGSENRTVDCGCLHSDCHVDWQHPVTSAKEQKIFYNMIVNCDPSKTLKMINSHMRVGGSLNVLSGTLTTGDNTYGYKLNVDKTTNINENATLNVGKSALSSGDVADFHSDLIVAGQISTDRDIKDGYADIRTYASRMSGEGTTDEIETDVQVYNSAPTIQVSNIYISGDLIIQTTNSWETNNPNDTLTIGGDLYIYNNFKHRGTIDLYGDFRENTGTNEDANIVEISEGTINMYNNKIINFNPSSGFGNLNIKSGTRSINESLGQTPYTTLDVKGNLTIDAGATLDLGTDSKNLNVGRNWTNNGTFVEGTQTVTFNGPLNSAITTGGVTDNTDFYNFVVDKTDDAKASINGSDLDVDNDLTINDGLLETIDNEIYLAGNWFDDKDNGRFSATHNTVIFDGTTTQTIKRQATADATLIEKFDSVIYRNSAISYIKNTIYGDMTINVGKTFDANGMDLVLKNNFVNNGTFTHNNNTVRFEGNVAQVFGGNATEFYNLAMNNSSTGLNLKAAVSIANNLTLTDGNINTTNGLLTINDNATSDEGSENSFVDGSMKKIGDEAFIFPVGDGTVWARLGLDGAGGTSDEFTVEYHFDSIYNPYSVVAPLENGSSLEYWDINSTDTPTKQITLYSESIGRSGIGSFADTDLLVGYWNGSAWDSIGRTTCSPAKATAGWLKSTNISSFGNKHVSFVSKSKAKHPLPIELLAFDAYKRNTVVDIVWTTVSEINTDYFIIEKSLDMETIEDVGKVNAAGNSSATLNYKLIDSFPYTGVSYYRLRTYDLSGEINYSHWAAVEFIKEAVENKKIKILNVFPNPTKDNVNMHIFSENEGECTINFFDLTGRIIFTDAIKMHEGTNIYMINMRTFAPGTYVLKITSAEGTDEFKVVKQ